MNVRYAAEMTRKLVAKHYERTTFTLHECPKRSDDGKGIPHQMWLLDQVAEGAVTGDKACRWLSWAQAMLTASEVLTLDQCKTINALAS